MKFKICSVSSRWCAVCLHVR